MAPAPLLAPAGAPGPPGDSAQTMGVLLMRPRPPPLAAVASELEPAPLRSEEVTASLSLCCWDGA